MTEADWWAATNPLELTAWLIGERPVADRKSRLFSLSCCRLVHLRLRDWPCSVFLNVLEKLADEEVTAESIPEHIDSDYLEYGPMHILRGLNRRDHADAMLRFAFSAPSHQGGNPWAVVGQAEIALWDDTPVSRRTASASILSLLHDLFGPLPFRDVPIHPDWLTSTVVALARGIYDEKAFDRMPILADALQDAGCDNDEILSHCRQEGWEHVRGCWVIDMLLGRPWRE